MQLSAKRFDTRQARRTSERLGVCPITETFAVISIPLSRQLELKTTRNGIYLEIHTNQIQFVIRAYIDPTLDVVRQNFDAKAVLREIFLTNVALAEFSITEGDSITIQRIIPSKVLNRWENVILTPTTPQTRLSFSCEFKNYFSNNTVVSHSLKNTSRVVKNNSTIAIPNLSPKNTQYSLYTVSCKGASQYGIIDRDTAISLNRYEDTIRPVTSTIGEQEQKYFIFTSLTPSLETMITFSLQDQLENPSRSFLLYGPHGVGKTTLVHNIASRLGTRIRNIAPSDIYSKLFDAEEGLVNLSNLFKQAVSLAPCIVLFDEMDVLLPNEEKDVHLQNEFLFILRAIPKGICLVCITSNIDRFDYSIRKKFDEEVFIDAPSNQERLELLKQVLPKDLNILEINAHCHGFVQADIQMIAKQVSQESTISQERVLEIVRSIRPYSLTTGDQGITDSVVEIPQVTWEQVGGLEHVKSKIIEMIVWPLQHAESYLRMSIKPPTGLLLYGPPGTGKTMIAKAIATAASANFIAINIPDLIKAEVGESEKTLANVFRRAKLASPCVLFFDEIQAMFGKRSEISRHQQKLVSQLMLELDGIEKSSMRVVLVAATNVPQSLDPSLLRPGRLENILYVGPPDRHARKSIWEMTIGKMKVTDAVKKQIDFIPNAFEQETISFSFDFSNAQETFSKKKASFVDRSEGFTGADIVNLCQHAGLNALIESMDVEAIDLRHFEKAFELFRPSVTKKMIRFYEKFKVDKT